MSEPLETTVDDCDGPGIHPPAAKFMFSVHDDAAGFDGMVLFNWPNPATSETHMAFNASFSGNISIEVYNASGWRIKKLFNRKKKAGRNYNIDFKVSNLSNGIYFIRITGNGDVKLEKLMITR